MPNIMHQFHRLTTEDRMKRIASELRRVLNEAKKPDAEPLPEDTVKLAKEAILVSTRFLEPVWVVTAHGIGPVGFMRGRITQARMDKFRRKAVWRGMPRKTVLEFKQMQVE